MHGSLARAGKVRAQTPKVEKQEKKKKKTGKISFSMLGHELYKVSLIKLVSSALGVRLCRFIACFNTSHLILSGRAARRIQYNRRFVNIAVSGIGRKRGPNSNVA